MKTPSCSAEEVKREWQVVDASGQVLGRLASQIAKLLMGKHKSTYTPHLDTGDYVIVLNAAKVKLTGKKGKQKIYYRHSGHPGGLRELSFQELFSKRPTQVIEIAVKGMLPKNRLGKAMFKKLKVYSGSEHPHHVQVTSRR